jgi:2-keto-4-pentenoate hydratase/2-oxohepta-3-ene-1,7-dioic acid hydratase in catechol pathway
VDTDVDPMALHIETLLNGQVVQDARTSDTVFDALRLVNFVPGLMTLLTGDVILTGTVGDTGSMDPGDTVEVRIEGIGTLKNRLV